MLCTRVLLTAALLAVFTAVPGPRAQDDETRSLIRRATAAQQ